MAKLKRRVKKTLSVLGCEEVELSIWIADDDSMRNLHREYFGIDEPTNVISFSQREGAFCEVETEMLGDIVIGFETARRDAEEAGKDVGDELFFLAIHGMLHLLGYDHEGERAADGPAMEAREEELYRMVLG